MLKKQVNYIDMVTLEECIENYRNSRERMNNGVEEKKQVSNINIIGVGELGRTFIEYCNHNNRWNNDNSVLINSINNINKRENCLKLVQKLSFITLDQYLVKEHNDFDVNIFLYNLSELGEFDKFINKLIKIKSPFNIIFGVRTKHSKLQFDIIVNKLTKDSKLPIVLIDEEKLLEETNNYIIYELYTCAREFIEI